MNPARAGWDERGRFAKPVPVTALPAGSPNLPEYSTSVAAMVRPQLANAHCAAKLPLPDLPRQRRLRRVSKVSVYFGELRGKLESGAASSLTPCDTVILSNISHGSAQGTTWDGFAIRFVGRGTENYRIRGRNYRVREGQLMIAPQKMGSEVEIRRDSREGTLGLCIFLSNAVPAVMTSSVLQAPIVLSASCSDLGRLLAPRLSRLQRPGPAFSGLPQQLIYDARPALARTLAALGEQMEGVTGKRLSTRFEIVRKMSLAQDYLHSVADRSVPLDELALAVGVSPFQLLRNFRECFGHTPAAYHRRLRLLHARALVENGGGSYEAVANEFGFASGSSLSHAHRRAFGTPPLRASA